MSNPEVPQTTPVNPVVKVPELYQGLVPADPKEALAKAHDGEVDWLHYAQVHKPLETSKPADATAQPEQTADANHSLEPGSRN